VRKIIQSCKFFLRGEVSTNKLIKNGLKVGENFNRQQGCIIDPHHCWLISIGNDVIFAPRVHILAHDASTKIFTGYTKIGRVDIGNNVFIGAGTIILPNVSIGDNVVVGAGSVVTRNLPSSVVATGNPATVQNNIDGFIAKNEERLNLLPRYGLDYTYKNISTSQKQRMKNDLEEYPGFIK
jgi:maltose O-acetyltransferase